MIYYIDSSDWFKTNVVVDGDIVIIIFKQYDNYMIIYKIADGGLSLRLDMWDVNIWCEENNISIPFENKEDEILFLLTFG